MFCGQSSAIRLAAWTGPAAFQGAAADPPLRPRPPPRWAGEMTATRTHYHDVIRHELASGRAGWHNEWAESGEMGCRPRSAGHPGTSRRGPIDMRPAGFIGRAIIPTAL